MAVSMNKIKKMYAVWTLIVILIFIFLTILGFLFKNKTNIYKVLENQLVEAEKKYVDAKFLYPTTNEPLKINAKILIENGYMDELKIQDEICDGYAIISKKGTVFEYKGFVSCSNYKTKGYEQVK